MKTLEQVAKEYKSDSLDGRDLTRLALFIPEEMLKDFGLSLKEEYKGKHKYLAFVERNIISQLEEDVAFGFEKALDKRGLSAGMMHDVVMMWNWILENELSGDEEYKWYGLPLFKKTAVLYGFDNPIGSDNGTEDKYSD